MKYCKHLKLINGLFTCDINGETLECKCKDQIKEHSDKYE